MIFPKLYQPEKSQPKERRLFSFLVRGRGLIFEWAYNAAASVAPTLTRHFIYRISTFKFTIAQNLI